MVSQCTSELARHVDPSEVVVNCVSPGWCKTNLFRLDDGGLGGRIGIRLIGRTSEQGSRALVHAVSAGAETHGRYLNECTVRSWSAFVQSPEGQRTQNRLWLELVTKLESAEPGVSRSLQEA